MRTSRLLSIFLFALGGFLGLGATGEIVLALDPGLLPSDALEIPFMAAHQTSWALRAWMLGSNAANLVCAIMLVSSANAIKRAPVRGWRQLRVASGTLASIALVGVLVCLPYLLPLPAGPAAGPAQFMLVSVVCAGGGLAMLCLVLFWFAQRATSRRSSASACDA